MPPPKHAAGASRVKHTNSQLRTTAPSTPPGIPWPTLPSSLLARYRLFYALDVPPAFASTQNAAVLTTSSIGMQSPTMVRGRRGRVERKGSGGGVEGKESGGTVERKGPGVTERRGSKEGKSRVSKEQLALAVRKHFNGLGVSEVDVMVELGYKVGCRERGFRAAPGRR